MNMTIEKTYIGPPKRHWSEVGKAEVSDSGRPRIEAEIAELEWEPAAPGLSMPMMQGMSINTAIKNLRLPRVTALAWNGVVGNFALIGIECNYAMGRCRVYILDTGMACIPVAHDFWPTAD